MQLSLAVSDKKTIYYSQAYKKKTSIARTFADAVSDDVFEIVNFLEVVKRDEMLADRLTGDRCQLVQIQVLANTDSDHRYISVTVMRSCGRQNRLVRCHRLTVVGQQNRDARVTFPGAVVLQEAAENQLVDGKVRAGVACFDFDVVQCFQYFDLRRETV